MKTKIVRANERGRADFGWLKANYSFSFANYYNPSLLNFGALRVLNDDIILGGNGFGMHPHENMEIISIPLKGSMKHKDSMSNTWIPLQTGEVQVMSAGTGINHSEMNYNSDEEVNLFQIWIIPNKMNVKPRYQQMEFDKSERKNKLQILVSSENKPVSGSLTIYQDAQISRIDMDQNSIFNYTLNSKFNGLFLILIEGEVQVDNTVLGKRDSISIEQTSTVKISSTKNSQLLFIEIPLK